MTPDMEQQPPQPRHLLGLPGHIRHRIYLYLGVAHLDGHPYTYCLIHGHKAPLRSSFVRHYNPPPGRDFTGLFRSCRTLYREAAALLYSANRFVVYYHSPPHHINQLDAPLSYPGSLRPLHALSPTALAALTSLKIVLNECSCHQPALSAEYPPKCCGERTAEFGIWGSPSRCTERHSVLHCPPLLDSARGFDLIAARLGTQAMMSEWHDVAAYLSSHITAGRLELSVVCDIDPEHPYALEAGRLAVAPIALFPRLKDIQLRLSHLPSSSLRPVAQDAVFKTYGRGHGLPYFRPGPPRTSATLMSLPTELRLRILDYTDLITPWREVTWSRQQPKYTVCQPPCRLTREDECPPHIHRGCRLIRCYYSGGGGAEPGFTSALGPPPGQGCFCGRRHAAVSAACRCWAPPTDLFLVCRALCREAQFIFFSGNRFVVHDFCAMPPWKLPPEQLKPREIVPAPLRYPFRRFAASCFLRHVVPPHCLAHLRFLELVFPPYLPGCWPGKDFPALGDWRAAIDRVRGGICAPALTVRVVMADFYGMIHGRLFVNADEGNAVIAAYRLITQPLKRLAGDDGEDEDDDHGAGGGLAGCYVQPAYPWKHTAQARQCVREQGKWWLAAAERSLKEDLERGMRGGGRGGGSGKAEPARSVWQRAYDIPLWSW